MIADKTIHIQQKYIMLFLLLIPILQPKICTQYTIPTVLYAVMNLVEFAWLMKDRIRYGSFRLNKIIVAWILIRLYILLLMILNNTMADILQWGYQSLMVINLLLLFEHTKYSKYDIAKVVSILGASFLIINFCTLLAFPRGIIRSSFFDNPDNDWYFLGIKTQISTMMFPTLSAALYCFYKDNKKSLLIISIISCLINIIYKSISTAWVGVGILVIMFLIRKLTKIKFSYLFLFCISLLICILVVFFDFQNYFSFIIVNLLGKDLTLSNRIYLWSRAVDIIFNSSILQILFGHGQVVRFVPNAGSLWNPHNALLASLYNSGIIGTVAFYLFLYKLGNNKYYSSLQQGMMIIVFTLMVMSITENYFEVAYVFVPFLLLRYADDVV